jgi:enoyl-[acyl-carrier protein] reductase/trans-2-enoyl-CoA reductase (NAD+)
MKEEGIHEGCIEQIVRLFNDRLYSAETSLDDKGRIRVDDLEMRPDIQAKVLALWSEATTQTLPKIGDLKGYELDFFNLFGFKVDGVDYTKDVSELVEIPGLQ